MKTTPFVLFCCLAFSFLLIGSARAQVSSTEANPSTEGADMGASGTGIGEGVGQQPQPVGVDPTNISGFQLGIPEFRSYLRYGAEVFQGVVTQSSSDLPDSGAYTVAVGGVELVLVRPKFQLLMGTTPLVGYYPGHGTLVGIGGIFNPSFAFAGNVTPRVRWALLGGLKTGQEGFRYYYNQVHNCNAGFCSQNGLAGQTDTGNATNSLILSDGGNPLDAQSSLNSGEAPIIRPLNEGQSSSSSDLVIRDTAHSFAQVGVVGQLTWRESRRDLWALEAGQGYSMVDSYGVTFAGLSYTRWLRPSYAVGIYSHMHRYEFAQTLTCGSVGTGIGFADRLSRETTVSLEIGPEYGSSECGKKLNIYFNGGIQSRITREVRVWAGASRDDSSYYLPGSRWFDAYQGGVEWRVAKSILGSVEGGYFRSGGDLANFHTYSGWTISPQVGWEINRSLQFGVGYRYFESLPPNTIPPSPQYIRGGLGLTLRWRPRQLPL